MSLSKLLKTRWYPKFLPKIKVNSFKIAGWKVLSPNAGTVPGKPLLCKRSGQEGAHFFSYKELTEGFVPETTFIDAARRAGYYVESNDDGLLKLVPIKS